MAMARNRSNQVKSYFITNYGLREDNYCTRNHTAPYNGDKDVVTTMQLIAVRPTPPRNFVENQSFVTDSAESADPVGDTAAASAGNGAKQGPADLAEITEPTGDATGGKTCNTAAAAPSAFAMEPSASDAENVAGTSSISENFPIDASVALKRGNSETSVDRAADTASPCGSAWKAGRWNIKTNIPFWALVVPNIAVEYRFADHWSVDIPIYYMPVTVARNYRFRTLAVSPSVRYRLKPAVNGHFFGVHLIAGQFNIAVDKKCRYQDAGGMFGAGLDYGYALKFTDHWGMECNIGAGYIYTRYNTYYNTKNGACFDTSRKNYFGVTRFGISLIYRIK